MYDELLTVIVKILASLLSLAGTYLLFKLKVWLSSKINASEMEMLDKLIKDFCEAAEQQFKTTDQDGEKRFAYVINLLGELGYAITDEIKAKIEAKVFNINQEMKIYGS